MRKITPWLWFDGQAEQAAEYYASIFPDAKMGEVRRYTDGGPMPAGTVMTAEFEVAGQPFVALNGGAEFSFNESVSFYVDCQSQEEADQLWERLTADGGVPGQCGWLKDKFGLSWQVIPHELVDIMNDPDPQRVNRAMNAMLKMGRIEVADLRAAADAAGH
jgi:predicted 3-demethylubiquinone-9 3-methyltransferase (glyoxalase superfamily)